MTSLQKGKIYRLNFKRNEIDFGRNRNEIRKDEWKLEILEFRREGEVDAWRPTGGQYIAKVRNLMSLPCTVGSCYVIVHNNYDVIN